MCHRQLYSMLLAKLLRKVIRQRSGLIYIVSCPLLLSGTRFVVFASSASSIFPFFVQFHEIAYSAYSFMCF